MSGGVDPSAFRAFEASAWGRIPDRYDDFWSPITARAIEPLLDAAAVRRGTRVLDVATGPGHAAGRAAARGARVIGVDLSPEMVAHAAGRHPAVEFRAAPAETLPWGDGAFDAVICGFGLGHFAEAERVLAELARVTAPGGRLALSWWSSTAECRVLGVFHEAVASAGALSTPGLPAGPPVFAYSEDAVLEALLRGAGWDDVEIRDVRFSHHVASPDAFWDAVLASTVRTAAAISSQPEPVRAVIRAAFDRLVAPYRTETGLDLPVAMKIASGARRAP